MADADAQKQTETDSTDLGLPKPHPRSCGCGAIAFVVGCVVVAAYAYQVRDYKAAVAPFEELTGHDIPAGGDGMNAIHGRRAVSALYLGYPQVDDRAMETVMDDLKRLPNLRFIDLEGSSVSDGGMDRLREELPGCR